MYCWYLIETDRQRQRENDKDRKRLNTGVRNTRKKRKKEREREREREERERNKGTLIQQCPSIKTVHSYNNNLKTEHENKQNRLNFRLLVDPY